MEVVEHDVHRAEVWGIRVQQQRLSRHGYGVADARRLAGEFLDSAHHALRPQYRCGIWQLDVDEQIALVLRGDETLGGAIEAGVSKCQQAAVNHQYDHADTKEAADGAGVYPGGIIKGAIEAAK